MVQDEHEGIARMKAKSRAVRAIFSSPEGKKVLELLSEQFDQDDLRGDTVQDTYYNLGQRDVLIYIRQLIRLLDKQNG